MKNPQKSIINETVYEFQIKFYNGLWNDSLTREIDRIFSAVDAVLTGENMDYFLWAGSFLGAVRNNSVIPWDDDADIATYKHHFKQIWSLAPVFKRFGMKLANHTVGIKVCFEDKPNIRNFSWSWPFVDLWELEVRNTTLLQSFHFTRAYKPDDIAPPRRALLDGLLMGCPNNFLEYMKTFFPQ